MNKANDIDSYIAEFPEDIQNLLQQMRSLIKSIIPEAEEVISYAMPAFKLNGIVVYFAALKNHIGFYPTPSGIEAFKEESAEFKSTKGALQFPYSKPLPVDLITKITKFRAHENLAKAESEKKAKIDSK